MSDIEFVIKKSKLFEGLLEAEFHAQGKGLHEKLNCVEQKLPPELIKQLRFIATIRNKLVHEPEFDQLNDRQRFENTCREVESGLLQLAQEQHRSPPHDVRTHNEAESALRPSAQPAYNRTRRLRATSGGSGWMWWIATVIVLGILFLNYHTLLEKPKAKPDPELPIITPLQVR